MYQPRDIAWIKESLIAHFSGQQSAPAEPRNRRNRYR